MPVLIQRRSKRDPVDLFVALEKAMVNTDRIVAASLQHMFHGGHNVTCARFDNDLEKKLHDPQFDVDIRPLLTPGFALDINEAAENVRSQITGLPPVQESENANIITEKS